MRHARPESYRQSGRAVIVCREHEDIDILVFPDEVLEHARDADASINPILDASVTDGGQELVEDDGEALVQCSIVTCRGYTDGFAEQAPSRPA